MKNKKFFYLQYNKINWKNQEKTKINSFIYERIIKNIILLYKGDSIAIFDIGFGIGFFVRALIHALRERYKNIIIEGCEPSRLNYKHFLTRKPKRLRGGITLRTHQKTFQDTKTETKFDFITAVYVLPHFASDDLEDFVRKAHLMLKERGKFILVTANESYLANKLKTETDLSIETRVFMYKGKQYKEILHYSDIPKIGKVIDYDREEAYNISLFESNKFKMMHKENINDNGFLAALFVFEKVKS